MPETGSFRHVVLTRFNCRFGDRDFPARTQPNWLNSRLELFERYCLPTMKAQTSQAFDWLIFFDPATPEDFLSRIRGVFGSFTNFHIRFLEVYTGELMKSDVRTFLDEAPKWLVSTRLDNDDGLNRAYVERLQREVTLGTREALNFPYGIVLAGEKTYLSRQTSNAFLSVSEPFAKFDTALGAQHKDMGRLMPVRDLGEDPMWLQVIHDNNVSNKKRGRRVLRRDVPTGYESVSALSQRPSTESKATIVLENMTLSVAWAGRDAAAHLYRQLRHLTR